MGFGHLLSTATVLGAAVAAFSDLRLVSALASAVGVAAVGIAMPPGRARMLGALLTAGALSAAQAVWARDQVLHPRVPVMPDREVVQARGTILEDAQPAPDGGARLLVQLKELEIAGRVYPAPVTALVYVGGRVSAETRAAWTRGRTIAAPMRLATPAILRNPGGRSPRWQQLLRGYQRTGSIKSALLVETWPGPWLEETAAAVRARVRVAVSALLGPARAQAAGIIIAILIGDRSGLDPATERRLQAAGTYHVIAISGGNVAVLTGFALAAAGALARSYRLAAALTLALVLAYGWTVGGDPSVGRAVTAAGLYLSAVMAGVAPTPLHVLSTTALIVVALDPLTVVRPGAWLSYGATLGIVLFAMKLLRRVSRGPAPDLPGEPVSWSRRMASTALALLTATIAAEIILFPMSAVVFARVGVAGLLLNFVAIPAMAVVQCAGLAAVLLFGWWNGAAAAAAAVANAGVRALVDSTRLLDLWPWLSWRTPAGSLVWLGTFYLAVAVFAMIRPGDRRRRWLALGAAVALIGLLSAPETIWARPSSGRLRLTMIDVGQGEALLVQFPTGQSLLIDAGPATGTFDAGERVVTPALWALGVRSLDWLAVTHPDLDHIGGAASVAETLGAREIWEGVPVPPDPKRDALQRLIVDRGGLWRQLRRGDRLMVGAVSVDAVHPPEPDWERQRVRNDDSVVLRLRYGDVEMLLTGDVGSLVEQGWTREASRARLRVLKVAHHGSRTSSSEMFIGGYDPVVALVSLGKDNVFGHPAPEVMDRLAAVHARAWRTDRDGAISLETDGRELHVRTWSGASWTARVRARP